MKLTDILRQILLEDRCKRIADRKYDKPSAYKSGAIVRCRKGNIWKGLKEVDQTEDFNYFPYSFAPNLNSLNKEEHTVAMNDLRKERMGLIDYIQFAKSMSDDPIYKSILSKLINSNRKKLDFTLDQDEMLDYEGPIKLQKFKQFYEKYRDDFPNWALENESLYNDVVKNLRSSLNEKVKETLRTWFKRKGAPGKTGGWVDCNTCREVDGKTKCKACGRQKGEKRAKYPSCRPTPAQCKTKGKGKKWGKTK